MEQYWAAVKRRIWELHNSGKSISEIVDELRFDPQFVIATITGIWYDDGVVDEAA